MKLKTNYYWRVLILILILMFVFGIKFLFLPCSDGKMGFIVENMVWFPIELAITLFAINKIIEKIQVRKERERFKKVTRRANKLLIGVLKRKVVSVVVDTNVYDSNRDETKIYGDIIMTPDKYLTDEYFKSSRSYNFNGAYTKNYNIIGVLMVECSEIDKHLKEYINRFSVFFDDDLYENISILEQMNYYTIGTLNNKSDLGKIADKYQLSGDFDELREKLKKYFFKINELINLLENY